MSEIEVGMTASAEVVLTALAHWNNGRVDDAIALFAEEFRFNDHGSGLKFKEKERLAEFFRKNRELYPDAELQTDTIFLRGDRAVVEWTLRAALVEPFLRRALTQGSNLAAWGFHRADGEREDYGLDGLLRRTDLATYRFGCALRGMGRTLNGCGSQRPRSKPCPPNGLRPRYM